MKSLIIKILKINLVKDIHFITGAEGQEERKINKDQFNDEKNKRGEYIQIMMISSAGAEGISLTCVRTGFMY